MTEKPSNPPDRLSLDPRSKFFDSDLLQRGVGIRFKDKVRTNILEYCISEGWVRVPAGKSNDRHGNPMTVKLNGPVVAWFEDSLEEASGAESAEDSPGAEDTTSKEENESEDEES